jgi:O-antigen/teichoic acid export membrane protein
MLKAILGKSAFFKNVLLLTSGTVIAQVIPVLIAPFLTRIYMPESFGFFGVYFSLAVILGSIATFKYELAIMLPKKDSDAINVSVVAAFTSLVFSLILLITIYFGADLIAAYLKMPGIRNYLYLLPISVFLIGLYESLNYWLIRKKKFKYSSLNKISHKTSESVSAISLGFAGLGGGLIFSEIFGRAVVNFACIFQLKKSGFSVSSITFSRIKKVLFKYRAFPIFNAFPSFLNAAASNFPVLLVGSLFTSSITGFFNLSRQVLSVPLSMISLSLAQVLYEEAVSKINKNEPIEIIFRKLIMRLGIAAIVMLIGIIALGPIVFGFFFGSQWIASGEFAAILSLGFAAKFIVSPLSILLPALNKAKLIGLWQLGYFGAIVSLFFLKDISITHFLFLITGIDVLAYGIYFLIIRRQVSNYHKALNV